MSFAITKLKDIINGTFFKWARKNSLWILTSGIKCCAIEMLAVGPSRYDPERFGMIFRPSPRHADVIIINGPITYRYAEPLKRLWSQMPEPKWAISTGECSISGGPFWESYNVIGGGDSIIPIDVYVPGCPVRPEAIIYGAMKLQEKIDMEAAAKLGKGKVVDKPIIVTRKEVKEAIKNKEIEVPDV